MNNINFVKLDASRIDDFYLVHSDSNGFGWCKCVAWWVESWDGWSERTEEENKNLRESLFEIGEFDGYLLYVDGKPVGWCQAGPRDRLKKLVLQFQLEPDPTVWAITCFCIAPEYRGKGLSKIFLLKILDDLKNCKVKRVEAYPKASDISDAGDLWTGPIETYLANGFEIIREDPLKPVLSIRLND